MLSRRNLVVVAVALVLGAAAFLFATRASHSARQDPRFLTLGELARDLAGDEKSFDVVVDKLGGDFAPLGDAERALLLRLFRAHDWSALDRQPETTLDTLAHGLALLADYRASHPPMQPRAAVKAPREPLGIPTGIPALAGEPYLSDIGFGLKHGDTIAADKRARFGDSERLAAVLDRLALNDPAAPAYTVEYAGEAFVDVNGLVAKLAATGHTVVVLDQRLAANFGDLLRGTTPVATPLWISTGRAVDGDVLALPVPHAQLLLSVRGPVVNADVTLYPALDLAGDGSGGTHFRSDVTTDQPWCGGVDVHRYEGAQALEAVHLMALLPRFVDVRVREKKLPLDGYFALGVCTLAPAIVELALTKSSTIWPLTHDPALFDGDSEIDKLARALPHDGHGAPPPDDARLFASVPWPTLASVPFAHTRAQLKALGWHR